MEQSNRREQQPSAARARGWGVAGAMVLALVLAACGGGGGGGDTAPPPNPGVVTPGPAPGATTTFSIGGTVSGLSGTLVLRERSAGTLTVNGNGPFTFGNPLAAGTAYEVTVATQPTGQVCTVANGSGTVMAPVTGVSVSCQASPRSAITVLVTSLVQPVLLTSSLGDAVTATVAGSYTLATPVVAGQSWSVAVQSPSTQSCTVSNGSGVASGQPLLVTVSCASGPGRLSGFVSGLNGGAVAVRSGEGQSFTAIANGPFAFPNPVATGVRYTVTVIDQSPGLACSVLNGTGTMAGPVSNVLVTCRATASTARFVYVANRNDNTVSGYAVNADTGALTAVAGSPFAVGVSPGALATDPAGRFLHVANAAGNSLSVFAIGSSGGLTAVANSPFATFQNPTQVTIDNEGRFAFLTHALGTPLARVSAMRIDPVSTTVLEASSVGTPMERPSGFVLDVTQRWAWVGGAGAIASYSVSSGGTLTAVAAGTTALAGEVQSLATDPAGRALYAANGSAVLVHAINADSGRLTGLPAATLPGGSATHVVAEPTGRFVYASASQGGVYGFRVAADGSLQPMTENNPFSTGTGSRPAQLAVDPFGRFLYVVNAAGNSIAAWRIDATSGLLSPVAGSPFATGATPQGIVITPR